MLRVRQFDHVNLSVRDVERSITFYTGVLGLKLVRRDVNSDGKTTFVSVKAGPQIIDLIPRDDFEPPRDPDPRTIGYNHLAMVIESIAPDELIEYLTTRGVEIHHGPSQVSGAYGMGTAVYVYDPNRYVVELKQYPANAREVAEIPSR